ncbi:MAG: hypothetical protein AAFW59_02755 [Pseudomonadota bacterium]
MSSNPDLFLRTKRHKLTHAASWLVVAFALTGPLAAKNEAAVTQSALDRIVAAQQVAEESEEKGTQDADQNPETPASEQPVQESEDPPQEERFPINLAITVPNGEVNQAQVQECEDRADAGEISGEIVVCRRVGQSLENSFSGGREAAQRRYAEETAFKGSPAPPDLFGIPDNGKGIGFGGVPPPALIIDVGALPTAPPGSDADRIARGLPPLGQDEELSEEEVRERREALGLPPPSFENKED